VKNFWSSGTLEGTSRRAVPAPKKFLMAFSGGWLELAVEAKRLPAPATTETLREANIFLFSDERKKRG
jgi:hypothetical protein